MILVGISFNTNQNGVKNTTLHVIDEFGAYYANAEAGRGYIGQRVETVYVGDFDCSSLGVGMEIDIAYDKAIKTQTGFFQPVKSIKVLKKPQ